MTRKRTSGGQHKVFLQKRPSLSEKEIIADQGVKCSICGDMLPGARELGVHILSAHCDPNDEAIEGINNSNNSHMDEGMEVEEGEDNLVIEGSPGESMEVELDSLEVDPSAAKEDSNDTQLITNLPREPTAVERKQKFMSYRLSDSSHRYICLVCDKMYTSRYNIRMHMNLHSGTNVHTCSFCGRNFAHKHVYESHVRTHTGERPFSCEKCDRKFGDRSNCASHMKRCTGGGGTANEDAEISDGNLMLKQEVTDLPPEELPAPSPNSNVKGEADFSNSIKIAPNVSLTPISKLTKKPTISSVSTILTPIAPKTTTTIANGAQIVFDFTSLPEPAKPSPEAVAATAGKPPPKVFMLNFQPQIVSVKSMSSLGIGGAVMGPSDEFENMGYIGEDDDEGKRSDGSEEVMIEPDISLDYDDIEEIDEPNEEDNQFDGKANQSSLSSMDIACPIIFTCSFCATSCENQSKLLDHLTNHIDIPNDPTKEDLDQGYMKIFNAMRHKFMCLSCGKFFTTVESINIHLKVHLEDRMYFCGKCNKVFPHLSWYESHLKIEHGGEKNDIGLVISETRGNIPGIFSGSVQGANVNDLTCKQCSNRFPSSASLSNHVRKGCNLKKLDISRITGIKDSSVDPLSTKKLKPKANRPPPKLILINTLDAQKLETTEHIIIPVSNNNNDSSIQNNNNNSNAVDIAEPSTPDSLASDALSPAVNPLSPSTSSPPMAPKIITIAPKPTESLLSEEAKRILHNSAPPPLPRRSSDGTNPRAHKIVETSAGREYIPDTNSNNIINLDTIYPPPNDGETKRGFMLRPCGHGGQQRYVCVDCGKHYTTSYNVRMHRNIHIGKNLYSCKFCNKEFSHKHVWETHERVHTGERPFKCPTCPKDFADRSNYNSHKKICLRLQQQQGQR